MVTKDNSSYNLERNKRAKDRGRGKSRDEEAELAERRINVSEIMDKYRNKERTYKLEK